MPNPENLKGKGFDHRPENINRKGRPVVSDIKRFIKERLAETVKVTGQTDEITKLEAIIDKLLIDAGKGNLKATELALKYGYGNPTQAIEVTGKDGQQLITHDFSKLNNDDLIKRIEQLELVARGGTGGGEHTAQSPEGGVETT